LAVDGVNRPNEDVATGTRQGVGILQAGRPNPLKDGVPQKARELVL
jgi:hypothetical protein